MAASAVVLGILERLEEIAPEVKDHVKNIIDKAEEFFPEAVEHSKDKIIEAMTSGLATLKDKYPTRYIEVSQKWREIVAKVEPQLAPVSGGRKKRTLRRKKHRTSK
jgi:hypothetical protein